MVKFEKVNRIKDEIQIPQRATNGSAGYDIKTIEEVRIPSGECRIIPIGLKIALDKDKVGLLVPRSSFFKKFHLVMPNSIGIIDSDYYGNEDNDGEFGVMVLNVLNREVVIPKDTPIAQMVITNYFTTVDDKPVKEVRNGGWGSTDE